MNDFRFPENKATKTVFSLFFFAMLYLARDTLTTYAVLGFYKAQFLMLGLLGLAGVVFLWHHRRNWKEIFLDTRVLLFGLFAVILLLPMAAKQDWQMMYVSVLLCLFFGVFLSYFLTLRETAKYYVVMMTLLGAYTILASYLLRILPDREMVTVPVVYNPHGINFYWLFPAYVPMGYAKTRNFGIFREPGVHQFFLILALVLNHYAVEWKSERKRWLCSGVLAVTMVTTMAIGGIASMGILAVLLFFEKKLYRKKMTWAILISGIVLVAAIVGYSIWTQNALYWELYGLTISKFSGDRVSVSERTDSILINGKLFLSNPLLGAKIAQVLHAIENNTSSTMIMFACYGIGGGLLHVASWVVLLWKKEQKLWINLGLLMAMFLSFNTQNLTADTFFWLFPTIALVEYAAPKLRRRKL